MNALTDLLRFAEIGLAAYARPLGNVIDRDSLKRADFVELSAARFLAQWSPISTYEHSTEPYWAYDPETGAPSGPYSATNGFAATVFENVATHERVLAIRGTNDGYDIATDVISVAALGSTLNQGQYQSLRAKVQDWMASGVLPAQFAVTEPAETIRCPARALQ